MNRTLKLSGAPSSDIYLEVVMNKLWIYILIFSTFSFKTFASDTQSADIFYDDGTGRSFKECERDRKARIIQNNSQPTDSVAGRANTGTTRETDGGYPTISIRTSRGQVLTISAIYLYCMSYEMKKSYYLHELYFKTPKQIHQELGELDQKCSEAKAAIAQH